MRRRSFLALGLSALLAPACAVATQARAQVLGRLTLSHPDPRFGGFSGLHLAANGRDALVMGDRGILVAIELSRDANGQLSDAKVLSIRDLPGRQGRALAGPERDSEGLAVGPDGSLFVSFEGARGGRIWRYPADLGAPSVIPTSPDFARLGRNSGLESLALDPVGRLLAMPEDYDGDAYPLWRRESDGWRILGTLPKLGAYRPVALDHDDEGNLWLLERRFTFAMLFSSRLSRIELGPKLRRHDYWQSPLGAFGNLEGLSMGRDAQGALRATMVADNNNLKLVRSELVEVVIAR